MMAENESPFAPDPETAPDTSYAEGEESRVASIAEQLAAVKDDILATVKGMIGGGEKPAPAEPAVDDDIKAQMREALGILKRREKARGEEKPPPAPPVAEKPPREFRKVTTRLWGDPE